MSAPPAREAQRMMAHPAESFANGHHAKLEAWRRRMDEFRAAGRRVVVWGAGSKGVTFLNMLGIDHSFVPFVVDLNPRKRGLYVAGTGQQVVAPDFLREYKPEKVLVMNAAYREEIERMLEELGVKAEILTV